jgi:predicted metal-dependent hydrolase
MEKPVPGRYNHAVQIDLPFAHERLEAPGERWLVAGARRVRLWFIHNRRARRYILRLRPDGTARLTVPRGGSAAEAARFAERNASWLEKQLLRQAAEPVRPKTWLIGSEILFRGEAVRLEAEPNAAPGTIRFGSESLRLEQEIPDRKSIGLPACDLAEAVLVPTNLPTRGPSSTPAPCPQPLASPDLRPAIERHLRSLAARELPARVFDLATLHQFSVRRVTVRNQRSRWGSCSRRGTISLNWRLIQTPLSVRDYIILHELAHLKEMNHSRRFWQEVGRLCPGFIEAERWLKAHTGLLR